MKEHTDLDVWQKSMDFVVDVYRQTRQFPQEERYGLTSQIRRSVISIPSNIAEGAARNSSKDFNKFLYIAMGSAAELETQLLIAERLGFLKDTDRYQTEITAIKKMLYGLINYNEKRGTPRK